jgi:hypothetical protein
MDTAFELREWEKVWAMEYVRNGGNATKAYQVARPNAGLRTCQTEGGKLTRESHIMEEVSRLRVAGITSKFLSADERRQFLADLTRANPQTVMGDKPHLAQSVTVTRRITDSGEVEEKVQVKLPDKLKAIQLDAMMAGELAPATSDTGELAPVANALEQLMGLALPSPAPLTLPAPPPPVADEDDLL